MKYAAQPSDDTVLVLVHPGGVKGKALVDGVKKAGAKVITVSKVTKAGERLEFVKGEFRRAGRKISGDAAQALLDAVGNDLRELAAACNQLVFDTEDKTISAAAVARYHKGRAEVTGFNVADSARRRAAGRGAGAAALGARHRGGPRAAGERAGGGAAGLAKVGGAPRNLSGRPAGEPSGHAAVEGRPRQAAAERLGPGRPRRGRSRRSPTRTSRSRAAAPTRRTRWNMRSR